MHPSRGRARSSGRRCGLLAGLLLCGGIAACADLSDVAVGVCGNRVVEPAAGEECDTVATLASSDPDRPAACGLAGTANACRYVWDATHACPTGWKQGQDQRCRQPSGAFGQPTTPMAELRGRRPQVADHDGDGQLDVMVDTPDDLATVPFYLARSASGFSATPGIEAAAGASLGDLTGDGIADIATTVDLSNAYEAQSQMSGLVLRRGDQERSGELRIYPGPSAFPGEAIYAMVPRPPPEIPDGAGEPAPDLQVAAAVYWDSQASCGEQICALREYEAFPQPIELVAPDSPPELAFASAGSGRDHGFVGIRGQIGFIELAPDGAARSFLLPLGQVFAGGITVGDFNGDDEEDVVLVTRRAATKQWHFLLLAGPSFGDFPTTLATVDALEAEGGPAFAFIDGDSIPDVVISGASSLDVDVGWKSGGIFVAHSPFIEESSLFETHAAAAGPLLEGSSSIPEARWTRHAVGDLNGDGIDDLVVARQPIAPETAIATVHFGGASFPDDVGEIVATAETAGSRSIEVGDFDADGRQDVAVFTGVGIGVAFNEGGRAFATAVLIGEGIQESAYGIGAVDVASLDGDAGAEILGLSGTGAWRRYDVAPGRSTKAVSVGMVQAGTGARSPGDFDGDGLDDLLRAAKGGLHVHWNDEDTFGPPDLFCLSDSLTEGAAGVASTDLDGDGLPDLIASTRNNQLVVLGGAGARRFREPLTLPSDSPGEVITADLDEDGELDMIVASALPGGGGQVEVHLSAE